MPDPPEVRDHRTGDSHSGDPVVRDHRGESGHSRPVPPTLPGWGDIVRDHRTTGIEHIFVLMLENRSFDHMLGFSGITGTDPVTGPSTKINGLTGTESNSLNGQTFTVQQGAANEMPHDPGHEFEDVLLQMGGPGATYPSGGAYPTVRNSGYVAAYSKSTGTNDPGDVMKCYSPSQLPVLTALAREFVVCDNWCASLPGPTWPNRMFAFTASSGGLDHSPSDFEISRWELAPGGGFEFRHGTIFDALDHVKRKYRIYAGDDFPMAAGLKGISIFSIRGFEHFDREVNGPGFDAQFVFIEPSYDVFNDYKDGTSGQTAYGDDGGAYERKSFPGGKAQWSHRTEARSDALFRGIHRRHPD
jgi:phospholipase C